jgi:hypothetical protein
LNGDTTTAASGPRSTRGGQFSILVGGVRLISEKRNNPKWGRLELVAARVPAESSVRIPAVPCARFAPPGGLYDDGGGPALYAAGASRAAALVRRGHQRGGTGIELGGRSGSRTRKAPTPPFGPLAAHRRWPGILPEFGALSTSRRGRLLPYAGTGPSPPSVSSRCVEHAPRLGTASSWAARSGGGSGPRQSMPGSVAPGRIRTRGPALFARGFFIDSQVSRRHYCLRQSGAVRTGTAVLSCSTNRRVCAIVRFADGAGTLGRSSVYPSRRSNGTYRVTDRRSLAAPTSSLLCCQPSRPAPSRRAHRVCSTLLQRASTPRGRQLRRPPAVPQDVDTAPSPRRASCARRGPPRRRSPGAETTTSLIFLVRPPHVSS